MDKIVNVYNIYDYVTYNTKNDNRLTILWDKEWNELDDLMKNEKPPFVTYEFIPYANYSWIDKMKEMTDWTEGYVIYIIGISINEGSYTLYFRKLDKKDINQCNGTYSDNYTTFINEEGYFVSTPYHWENEPLQNSERINCVYNEYIMDTNDIFILK
jgi:hypothetical protein